MKLFSLAAIVALFSTADAKLLQRDPLLVPNGGPAPGHQVGQLYVDKNFDRHKYKDIHAKNRVVMYGKFGDAKSDGLRDFLTGAGYDVYVVNINQQVNQSAHKSEHWLEHKLEHDMKLKGEIDFPVVYVDGHCVGGDAKVRELLHLGTLFGKK